MSNLMKILLSLIILVAALVFNVLDLFSFDSKFSIHPYLYGPADSWRTTLIVIRGLAFLLLGPSIVASLFIKKPIFRIYFPIGVAILAVLFATVLNQLEVNYSWRAYVVPQIKIEKIGKGSIGPNEYVDVKICNASNYSLYDLALNIKSMQSREEKLIPVLDEGGYGYKTFLPNECFSTKVFIPNGSSLEDLDISYGGRV